ncbi:MAG: flagellin [Actinobacteria bacterium]|nr:flagellin [Actinomycetota bacterium]
MRINHNIAALNTYRQLSNNNIITSKSLEKLSSGLRINRAGDDAAGLAISEKMRGQIRGLDQAVRNSQDGISMLQTAEGALNETHSILQRMRELAVQSANDTNTTADRAQIQKEIDQLSSEINRIASSTEFNTKKLINGDMGVAVSAALGAQLSGTVILRASGGALADGTTSMQALADANSNVFGIITGDTITLTGKKGDTYVSSVFTVPAATGTLGSFLEWVSEQFGISASGKVEINASGAIYVSGQGGTSYDLGAITMTVKDSSGNIRNSATEDLSALEKIRSAQDKRTDGTNILAIGANNGQNLEIQVEDMKAIALGINGLKVETQSQANISIKIIDSAMTKVSTERSKLGAYQNRLEHTINNLGTSSENLAAAESRIRDVDMAKEMMEFSKMNILTQAATAMLAQANQQPQGVLQLLR